MSSVDENQSCRESEEEQYGQECDDCGCQLDEYEVEFNDGICHHCKDATRIYQLQARLPSNMSVRKVTGNHRKPCSDCGTCCFLPGDFYVYDSMQPWGTDKYCMDCAELKYDGGGSSEDEDEDEDENEDENNDSRSPDEETPQSPQLFLQAIRKRSGDDSHDSSIQPPTSRQRF